jgi:hypothetical protein
MTLDDVATQLSPLVTKCTQFKYYNDYCYIGEFRGKPIFKISQNDTKIIIHVLCWDDKDRFHKETTVLSKGIKLITKSIKSLKDYYLQIKLDEIKNDF